MRIPGSPLRVPELDGIRGLAILMVLVWHFIGQVIDRNMGAWAKWLHMTTAVGLTGVDLFFVLSGVLITGIILDRQRDRGGFLLSFYKRRALRIFPPYLILLFAYYVFNVCGTLKDHDSLPLGYYLSFTQTWWMALHGTWGAPGLSVTWSVSVEEHYYVIFPIIILFTPLKAMPWLLAAIALASTILRAYFFFILKENVYYAYVFPFSRLDGLALGGLVACLVRDARIRTSAARHDKTIFFAAVCLAIGVEIFVGWGLQRDGPAHMYTWGHLSLAIVFSLLLFSVLISQGRNCTAVLRWAPLRSLGGISYSMYLYHPMVLLLVFKLAGTGDVRLGSWRDLLLLSCAMLATCTLARSVLKPIEERAIAFGRRFTY